MTHVRVLLPGTVAAVCLAAWVFAQPDSNAILEAEAAIVARAQSPTGADAVAEAPLTAAELPVSGGEAEVVEQEQKLEQLEASWPEPESGDDALPPPPVASEQEQLVPSMLDDDLEQPGTIPPGPPEPTAREQLVPSMLDDDLEQPGAVPPGPPQPTAQEQLVPTMLDDDLPGATPLPGAEPVARPLAPSPDEQTVTTETARVDDLPTGVPAQTEQQRLVPSALEESVRAQDAAAGTSSITDAGRRLRSARTTNVFSQRRYGVDDKGVFHSNVLVTVRDCIAIGLERNLGLTVDQYNPHLRYEDIRLQRSVFDPQYSMSFIWSGSHSPFIRTKTLPNGERRIGIGNSKRDRLDLEGSIGGKFITGMEYTFGMGHGRTRTGNDDDAVDPTYDSFFGGGITVPLLKGFGMGVNLAPIRIARNNWRIARIQLETTVQALITEIVAAYYTLYALYEDVNAKEYTLQIAYDLLAINEAKVAVGMAAPLEVTQAKARIAEQEESLIVSRNAIFDAEDELRRIINYEMDNVVRPKAVRPVEYHLIPVEKPEVSTLTATEGESIQTALKYRQSLRIANLNLRNAKEDVKVAKNNLLPEVNLLGSLEYSGLGDSYDNAYDENYKANHPAWSLGVEFTFPLFYNEPIATYRKARYARQQARLQITDEEHQVAIEVRSALRAVETNLKRIQATRESTRFAREQLRAEQEKFDVGQSTTFLVFEFQERLATAFSREILALAEWRISVAQFYEAIGRSLQQHGVVIDDYYANPYTDEPRIAEFLWQ
jgi:outer membrane protein TolC